MIEIRPCRIHAAVEHRSLMVCPFCAQALDNWYCTTCRVNFHPDATPRAYNAPYWRCVERNIS